MPNEENKYPKPYSRETVIGAKVSPQVRKSLRQLAAEQDRTVSALVKDAVSQYLSNHAR
ncbi:ribbon-helix-helix protein, CopG family [Paraburkholderia sp. NMBU_R16]|uniref:ribbon-helix-helix domain-containing protein n=1 Tax=Paraburkholderia sp. NMBU_R16 TaxID=2698676 RepID=UPI001563E0CE|nr:ribbon-helix-helix protein, CopG family [Paraburkholderia sp. NMBU_R16]